MSNLCRYLYFAIHCGTHSDGIHSGEKFCKVLPPTQIVSSRKQSVGCTEKCKSFFKRKDIFNLSSYIANYLFALKEYM